MSRLHQSFARNLTTATMLIAAALCTSCGHDDDLRLPAHPAVAMDTIAPDAEAIEQAMAAASSPQPGGLAWANTATGSAGMLSYTESHGIGGKMCRIFVSSRQSLSGGDILDGQACAEDDGRWKVQSLTPR